MVRLAPFVAFLFYFLLFSDEHNDDVQYHVEEDNLGIGILVDHRLAFIEKVEISIMLASLMKRAKFLAKFSSSCVI